ncbi:MAG: low specificity L-threonine aldolase [Euryarchaeota archaeon]|jgi:threonine aldolase|nr:low specificity L-threonine aldolase [Euryarchaeota archaeon]MBT3653967.1 low specificity L-threonine aldolase [Euryarchaeota archaeon]MBT3758159.1 low specificity L-threonine aldolase [Euryarchaeota archaeon]MBT4051213.1 low specificity L-threonine aldolase [Euryarchaeota archaeon]MBT4346068.1 low specificity L-threonine aldolase [Euryarchaeota archaeon]
MHEHPSNRVDLRSDTITQPTSAMRERMATAEVGDDVLGDDPTVIELQNRIAEIFGKEASLFVPSGTMSNAIAIRAHTNPGDEIVTEATSHIYIYEGGGYAALSGCSIALVPGRAGLMEPADVQKAIRKVDGSFGHFPNGSLVCVENSSNRGGGSCYSQEVLDEIAHIAHANDCAAHMDGARIFNAAIATKTDVARMVRDYDSISICLSKGLGAPVGSMLIGDSEFIALAHRWRKMFGGGMRQAGILAAAGLFALDHNVERLEEDHIRAKRLAAAVNEMLGFSVDLDSVQSNMVYISTAEGEAQAVVDRLANHGVDTLTIDESTIRAVIHLHITDQDIERAITAFESTI